MGARGQKPVVIVAGHICLDIIPTLRTSSRDLSTLLVPGKLVDAGPAVVSTGGAVSNTGLALYRLGLPTTLMGKVGDDPFGRTVLDLVGAEDPSLCRAMRTVRGEPTSYSIVISPPGIDRVFLHCPGTNHTFGAADVGDLAGARLLHFGYPTLMRRMYRNDGVEMRRIFRRAKRAGLTTSLDMAKPDPASEAGSVRWETWLERVLPEVDVFLPSLDEILYMVDRRASCDGAAPTVERLRHVADRLIAWGAAVVVLKLGDQGLYLKTSGDPTRLCAMGKAGPRDLCAWRGREILAPCFEVRVVGTTGAGDSTIAGFLAGLLEGLSPEDAVTSAVAVGACSVEVSDAVSGIPSWRRVQKRIRAGWKRRASRMALGGPDAQT
jgi:sugar/nucleoside kinase (ribokinase family)